MENLNLIKPTYSVIVLIYHRTPELVEMTKQCIESVKNSCDDYELIIVDNGSTERHDWESLCDTYVRLDKNMGISRGWNTGMKLARGKYIAIIGDDVRVRKGWLEAMSEALQQPKAGVSNPHVENLPYGIGIQETYKWFSGACFMMTPETIRKVGYFDEDTYWAANWEDVDYWTRVLKSGLKLYRNYNVSVRHKEGQTVHAKDISEYFLKNKERFIEKHGFNAQDVFFGNQPFPSLVNLP